MSLKHGTALALCCAFAITAHADEPEAPGIPPTWAIVKKVDAEGKRVELLTTTTRQVQETIEFTVDVCGRLETRIRVRSKDVYEQRVTVIELDEVDILTVAMKPLPATDALKRLKPDQAVLVHHGKAKLDPRYLALLRDDGVIVVMPPPKPADDPDRRGPIIIVPPPVVPLPPAPPDPGS